MRKLATDAVRPIGFCGARSCANVLNVDTTTPLRAIIRPSHSGPYIFISL